MSSERPPLLADVIRPTPLRDVLMVFLAAATIGLGTQLTLLIPWVNQFSFVIQCCLVLALAAGLGWFRGAAATVLFTAATLLGAPWLANGQSLFELGFLNPGFGYVLGFIPAAIIVGLLASRGWTHNLVDTFLAFSLGLVAIYAVGIPWLKNALDITWALAIELGMTTFLLGNAISLVVMAILFKGAWRYVPRATRRFHRWRIRANRNDEEVIDLTEDALAESDDVDDAVEGDETDDIILLTEEETSAESDDDVIHLEADKPSARVVISDRD